MLRGLVRDSGIKRTTPAGRLAKAWVATPVLGPYTITKGQKIPNVPITKGAMG